jgi:hypothetical protein
MLKKVRNNNFKKCITPVSKRVKLNSVTGISVGFSTSRHRENLVYVDVSSPESKFINNRQLMDFSEVSKCWETTVTNQNLIHEDVKRGLNSSNATFHL